MGTVRSIRSSSLTSSSSGPSPAHRSDADAPTGKRRKVDSVRHRPARRTPRNRAQTDVFRALARVKRKLIALAPCDEIMSDFLDRVTSLPGFTFEQRRGPKWLADAIARAAEELLDKPHGQSDVMLVSVPEHALIHGSITVGKYVGSVLYFEDIELGVVVMLPSKPSQMVVYMRLLIDPALCLGARAAPN